MGTYCGQNGMFSVRKGEIEGSENMWKDILSCKSEDEKRKMIDAYIKVTSQDANGFFGSEDVVSTGQGHGFILNDMNLYYIFFDNLKNYYEHNKTSDKKFSDGCVIDNVIRKTIQDYNGRGCSREKRLRLTETEITDDGDIAFPSIKKQYRQGTLLCTENAAISYNLWLLCGRSAYFCTKSSDNLPGGEEFDNDSHNFTVVDSGKGLVLYDVAMENYCKLQPDVLDKALQGQPFVVENVKNPGVYADTDGVLKEHKKNR